MTSMKIVDFPRPTPPPTPLPSCPPSTSNILLPLWPWTANFKRTSSQLKWNIIVGWLLYVIRSLLQLINLVWFSVDSFSFSLGQSRPQSRPHNNEKTRWDQGWDFFVDLHSWQHENSHPENCHLGKYPPRIIPTRTIPTQDNSHPENSHPG